MVSVRVFQLPQPGHFPSHFGEEYPHSEHIYDDFDLISVFLFLLVILPLYINRHDLSITMDNFLLQNQ